MVTCQKFDREKMVSLLASLICSDDRLDVRYLGRGGHSSAVDRVAEIIASVMAGVPEQQDEEEKE